MPWCIAARRAANFNGIETDNGRGFVFILLFVSFWNRRYRNQSPIRPVDQTTVFREGQLAVPANNERRPTRVKSQNTAGRTTPARSDTSANYHYSSQHVIIGPYTMYVLGGCDILPLSLMSDRWTNSRLTLYDTYHTRVLVSENLEELCPHHHHHHHHHRTFMMRLLQKGHRCITESTLNKIN